MNEANIADKLEFFDIFSEAVTNENEIAFEEALQIYINLRRKDRQADYMWEYALRPGLFDPESEHSPEGPGSIEQVMSNDQRKRHALEILGLPEQLTPENEATILSMLQEIDTVGDGYFSERDVCQYFTGTSDFMCGEKDHYVPELTSPTTPTTPNNPPTPPTSTEPNPVPKQAETFNDIWSLVLSLDDGELTKADLLNLIDYVMPNATQEEINYEFNLHDIDHDGVVDRNESYHVHHTEDLRMTIHKA